MAQRPDKTNEPTALPLKDGDGELVTYVPGEGDPSKVKWRGHVFRANVPKPIRDAEHVEAARGNVHFHVGPFDPARDAQPKTRTIAVTDGRSYRAHVVAWLRTCETAEQLVARWAADQKVRDLCEDLGNDDLVWLGTLIEPRMTVLLGQDDVPLDQAAARAQALWQRHGIMVLPWRATGEELARGMTSAL